METSHDIPYMQNYKSFHYEFYLAPIVLNVMNIWKSKHLIRWGNSVYMNMSSNIKKIIKKKFDQYSIV